jgi:hypothetical protein
MVLRVGLIKTRTIQIYILNMRCEYGIFGRECTKYINEPRHQVTSLYEGECKIRQKHYAGSEKPLPTTIKEKRPL